MQEDNVEIYISGYFLYFIMKCVLTPHVNVLHTLLTKKLLRGVLETSVLLLFGRKIMLCTFPPMWVLESDTH